MKSYQYKHAAVAGTFDHLHAGHKAILRFAFSLAKIVTVGIASEKLLSQKNLERQIESFSKRQQTLIGFLQSLKVLPRTEIIQINDIYGNAVNDKTLQAIVVTRETRQNAILINQKRQKTGLAPLTIVICPFLKDQSKKILRSTRIRQGLTDRDGTVYGQLFQLKGYILPNHLRESLRQPLGEVIRSQEKDFSKASKKAVAKIRQKNPPMVIAVGDIVALSLFELKCPPDLAIVDLINRREKISQESAVILIRNSKKRYINKPGTIFLPAAKSIQKSIQQFLATKKQQRIVIKGEEDLLGLPSILFAPLGAIVIYGQMGMGVVMVEVTEEVKKKVVVLLNKFLKQERRSRSKFTHIVKYGNIKYNS
ncbi:hypothetical protein A3F03_04435 [Candidatus Roizmanbacteria bacterium RIFCSPHIGHO2_12_FULL_41_11]|uniref:Cytidyltransferase-like domain-containing protein n=2 Tax=Candidatus Roizmaniibacteriota TaxID=1752723 RepID=A0A1F7J966_9BACT|nr:MAG: hypothetical protein A3F03_04435 [Candidatus Roizmanbacteria bacterium RIFCSPHIGHO2_12_FULL_41_11]OGK52154.1 MAG: hypothetical protein A2966_02010 [Candidatus Roizmanbacteria bacterium RIFCSPLOWO2_01_FULL_41_22]